MGPAGSREARTWQSDLRGPGPRPCRARAGSPSHLVPPEASLERAPPTARGTRPTLLAARQAPRSAGATPTALLSAHFSSSLAPLSATAWVPPGNGSQGRQAASPS